MMLDLPPEIHTIEPKNLLNMCPEDRERFIHTTISAGEAADDEDVKACIAYYIAINKAGAADVARKPRGKSKSKVLTPKASNLTIEIDDDLE